MKGEVCYLLTNGEGRGRARQGGGEKEWGRRGKKEGEGEHVHDWLDKGETVFVICLTTSLFFKIFQNERGEWLD